MKNLIMSIFITILLLDIINKQVERHNKLRAQYNYFLLYQYHISNLFNRIKFIFCDNSLFDYEYEDFITSSWIDYKAGIDTIINNYEGDFWNDTIGNLPSDCELLRYRNRYELLVYTMNDFKESAFTEFQNHSNLISQNLTLNILFSMQFIDNKSFNWMNNKYKSYDIDYMLNSAIEIFDLLGRIWFDKAPILE